MSDGKMTNSRFDGLWARATNNAGDAVDAKALAEEALRARSAESEQAAQLRQKDESIRALAAMLEHVTHTATGLHLLYRHTAKAVSDGSHEKLFADALALVKKARNS